MSSQDDFQNKEKIKKVAESYALDIWDKKDLSAVERYFHADCLIHSSLGAFQGKEAMRQVVEAWLKAFPDLVVIHDAVICENDRVVIQWKAKGTHQGDFKGHSPSKNRVAYTGVTVYRIQNEKIVEYWAYLDMQHLLSQIKDNGDTKKR